MVQSASTHETDANSRVSKTWLGIVGIVSCLLFVLLASAAATVIGITLVKVAWAVCRDYTGGY